MPAQADWVVIRCMDPRLNGPIKRLLRELKIPEAHGLISVPGGPQDINEPDRGVFLDAIERVSLPLHGAKRALLIQHTDCGAYGGRANCGGSEVADLIFHRRELVKAISRFRKVYPRLEVLAYVVHLSKGRHAHFFDPEGREYFRYRC